jgi:OOP family OmpA-OmpF porin
VGGVGLRIAGRFGEWMPWASFEGRPVAAPGELGTGYGWEASTMKRIGALLCAGLGVASGLGNAATGYVDDSQNSIVRTGFGDCVHTQRWSIPNAIAECEPEIVAARDKTDVAAVEVVIRTEERPIRLKSDALFDFDSAQLTESGKANLADMLSNVTAADLQEKKIQVHGYTDRIGPEEYNLVLSKRRAAAVQEYLVSKGVVPSFIEVEGFGEANPLVECRNERGDALIECLAPNRRTEVDFSAVESIEIEETVPVNSPE